MAKLFALRNHNRAGAAHATVLRHPARWEVAACNPAALQFWRNTASLPPHGPQEHPGDGRRWNGAVLSLTV